MSEDRLTVDKTWKLWIGGAFVRSESGRTLEVEARGRAQSYVCHGSRKDLRDAIAAARKAQPGWAARSAYNRGQILYRMAEMLEGASESFAATLAASVPGGVRRARAEVAEAIDRLVHYAGWADKYQQVLGCRNPVEGPYHVFSMPEPTGTVGVIAPDEEPLLGLIALIAPPLAAGCTVVALGSSTDPLATALFAEVCATSDLPPGSVNLLTGNRAELAEHYASHRGLEAIHAAGCTPAQRRTLEAGAAGNMKRVTVRATRDDAWYDRDETCSPWWIEPFVEIKTLWHPSAT